MLVLTGKGVSAGLAQGVLSVYKPQTNKIEQHLVADIIAEKERFTKARLTAQEQLKKLYDKALAEAGEDTAAIFDVHQMMLEDPDYVETIEGLITNEKMNAESAVSKTATQFADMFAAMDDAYMQARSADVKDISNRVIQILSGGSTGPNLTQAAILAAADLAPSETMSLDRSKLLGFITETGATNSHTAILARTMSVPAVVAVGPFLDKVQDGQTVIIDGSSGKIYLDPDVETSKKLQEQISKAQAEASLLASLKGKANITKSGKTIKIYANIGSPQDLDAVLKNDAGGIGLFRSEFLYLDKTDFPTEEEQFIAYKTVLAGMHGKEVVIRTLDIGADKQCAYFHLDKEANPALGYRAIRICLTQTDIFKTQLRAILRASAFGKAAIMLPMITSVQEVRAARAIYNEVKAELDAKKIPYAKDIPFGIMIETPAAALCSAVLAQEVDFFSIGTNDLTQYTLAIDRQNDKLDKFFDAHHPAVLKLIELTAKNAHAKGIWCGICGELGADQALTETFLNYGIDELSVSPGAILPLRKHILELP
jgi:phosphotransferase system enzyme I (PtsI)